MRSFLSTLLALTFIRIVHVASQSKAVRDARKHLHLVGLLSLIHNVDSSIAILGSESMIDL